MTYQFVKFGKFWGAKVIEDSSGMREQLFYGGTDHETGINNHYINSAKVFENKKDLKSMICLYEPEAKFIKPLPKCDICNKRRKLNEVNVCEECDEFLREEQNENN
jgi:hypothetical protein